MDQTQAPNEVQGPNMGQASHETQATNATPLNEGQPSTEILTSASFLAQKRREWHLDYWRDLKYWGFRLGVDPALMEFLIEMEQILKVDPQLRQEMGQAPAENRSTVYDKVLWWYHDANRDIDGLLAIKGQKTRVYLRCMEHFMLISMQAGDTDTADAFFRKITDLYRILEEEEDEADWQ